MNKALSYLISTHLGRYLLGAILAFTGGILSNYGVIGSAIRSGSSRFDIWLWIMYAGTAILLLQFIIHVVVAIINIGRKGW